MHWNKVKCNKILCSHTNASNRSVGVFSKVHSPAKECEREGEEWESDIQCDVIYIYSKQIPNANCQKKKYEKIGTTSRACAIVRPSWQFVITNCNWLLIWILHATGRVLFALTHTYTCTRIHDKTSHERKAGCVVNKNTKCAWGKRITTITTTMAWN